MQTCSLAGLAGLWKGPPCGIDLVPSVPASVDGQRVAWLHGDPLSLGNVFQIPCVDRLIHLYEALSAEFGYVQEHSPGNDSFRPLLHRAPSRAVEGYDFVGVATVPQPVMIPDVAQSI